MLQPVVPPILYKYVTSKTALLILQSGTLRWSAPDTFNDHAEFQRMPRFEPTIKEAMCSIPDVMLKAAKGEIKLDEARLFPDMHAHLEFVRSQINAGVLDEDIIKAFRISNPPDIDDQYEAIVRDEMERISIAAKVLCLTERPDNEVMWGNYADSHKGIVFGFQDAPGMNSPFSSASLITYSKMAPVVASGLDFILYRHDKRLLGKSARLAVCFSKKEDWSYEREWRLMIKRPNKDGNRFCDIPFLKEELESVTLGCKIPADIAVGVKYLVRQCYPHAKLFMIRSHHGELLREPI